MPVPAPTSPDVSTVCTVPPADAPGQPSVNKLSHSSAPRKAARPGKPRPPAPAPTPLKPEFEEPESEFSWFSQVIVPGMTAATAWLTSHVGAGYGLSIAVHGLIAIVLAFAVTTTSPGMFGNGGVGELNGIGFGDDPYATGTGFGESLTTVLELSGGQSSPLQPQVLAIVDHGGEATIDVPDTGLSDLGGPAAAQTASQGGSPTEGQSESRGTGNGIGDGRGDKQGIGGGGYSPPGGGKVVTQGNFSAWTVPPDPKPKQSYMIIIQVRYPRPGTRLRLGDVTGSVVGTDGFHRIISEYTALYLTKSNQVVVPIPGGELAVKDVIHVQSRLLKESQKLEIEF